MRPRSIRRTRRKPLYPNILLWPPASSLKLKTCANLVGGLIQILRVQGESEAEGDARTHLDVVGQGSDTAVIDFGLIHIAWISYIHGNHPLRSNYLCE